MSLNDGTQIDPVYYIAFGNPDKAQGVLTRFGYPEMPDKNSLASALRSLVNEKGQIVEDELYQYHPDREKIVAEALAAFNEKNKDTKHSCAVCGSSFTEEEVIYRDGIKNMTCAELTEKKTGLTGLPPNLKAIIDSVIAEKGCDGHSPLPDTRTQHNIAENPTVQKVLNAATNISTLKVASVITASVIIGYLLFK